MKPTGEIERGVLPAFRLFTGVQVAITALSVITSGLAHFQSQSESITLSTTNLLVPGLLLVYLSIPGLQRWLKSLYLPVGIVWSAVGLILDPYIAGNFPLEINANWLWRQIFMLCIPLVVVSWQYSMRQVLWFCTLTTVFTVALLSMAIGFREMLLSPLMVVVGIQLIIFLLVGYITVRLLNIQREQWQRLAEANVRLAQQATALEQLAISRERNRLARELHDILAHTLSGVAIELEGMRSLLSRDPDRAQALLGNSLKAIREGLTETRRALLELRAKPLEDLGLALAVRSLAESYAGRFDVQIEQDIDDDLSDYPIEVQQCVYRIAEEALANVANHAQAQRAWVSLRRDDGQLQLIVRDDGRGFDPGIPGDEDHYGLLGMQERAEMIGGSLAIESQIGKGTQISFSYGGSQ
jgi:signal transduction histidine kinase